MNEEFTPLNAIDEAPPQEDSIQEAQTSWQDGFAEEQQPQEVRQEPTQEKPAQKKNKVLAATSIVCFAVAALMVFCVLFAILYLWPEYKRFGENLEGSEGLGHGLGGAIMVIFYILSFILFAGVMVENVIFGIMYSVCYAKNITPKRQALAGAFTILLQIFCALVLVFLGLLWEGHPVIPYFIVAAIVFGGGILRIVNAVICLSRAKVHIS